MVTINYNDEEKLITLSFQGHMDTVATGKATDIIQNEPAMQNIKPDDKVVFDLKDVDYVASSFIRICISHAKMAGSGRFSIANSQPFVKKTFKISGLDDILNIT